MQIIFEKQTRGQGAGGKGQRAKGKGRVQGARVKRLKAKIEGQWERAEQTILHSV